VVNGAGYVTTAGTNLASFTNTWDSATAGGELPTLHPTQINVLAPPISSASLQVVNNGSVSSGQTVGVTQAAPAFFTLSVNQVVAIRSGNRRRLCGPLPGCDSSAGVAGERRLGADRDYARIFEPERGDPDCAKLTWR
jgi:hypothetical protein